MKEEGREKYAITDLYGNIKNQFRNANLSVLREVTYFALGLLFVLVQSNLDMMSLFFQRSLWRMLRVGVNRIWP
jgi:hypothetical protein